MTDTTTPMGGDESVEECWYQLLTDEGVDPEAAERIIRSLQSHPRFAFGNPDVEEVEEAINHAITEIDLEQEEIENPRAVKELMRERLAEGLTGRRPGPLSLLEPELTANGGGSDPEPGSTGTTSAPSGAHSSRMDTPDEDSMAHPEPSDEVFTAEEPGEFRQTAPEGAAPAAQGEVADVDSTAPESQPGDEEGPDLDIDDIDPESVIANMIVQHLEDERGMEFDEETDQYVGTGATLAVKEYRDLAAQTLFSELHESERELAYRWLIDDRIRRKLIRDVT